jgi:CCR4-NOT transcription complex subunit 6
MFTAATYNVLATCHLGRGDYSRVPPEILDPERRTAAVAEQVASFGAGLIFLQEVEDAVFDALQDALHGYGGTLEKRGGRSEGCATFWRDAEWRPLDERRLEYADRDRRVALVHLFEGPGGRVLAAANTHLTWDSPGTRAEAQTGYKQAEALLAFLGGAKPSPDAWVVAGDFNRSTGSEVLALFAANRLVNAHASLASAATFASHGKGRQIDFLLHTAALVPEPIAPAPLPAVMPCEGEPSDHAALMSRFRWAEVGR